MISDKVQDALNAQINAEMFSAYLYLSMSAHCESENLKGFGHWFRVQYGEETGHAMKIYTYLHDRGGKVTLGAIDAPQASWDDMLTLFQETLEHERLITSKVHTLLELATAEKDHATVAFLQWFVNEQVEEEANAEEIVDKLKLIHNAPGGLFMLDRELNARGRGH